MSNNQTANGLPTYLFATVEKQEINQVMKKLRNIDYIQWSGSTSGRYDFVAAFKGSDMQKSYSAVKEIRAIDGIVSTTCLVPFEGYTNSQKNGGHAMGQIFLRVDKPAEDVIQSLKKISGVTETLAVAGKWDILATVRGHSYEEILEKIVEEVSQVDGIRTSETTFVYKPTVAA